MEINKRYILKDGNPFFEYEIIEEAGENNWAYRCIQYQKNTKYPSSNKGILLAKERLIKKV